MISSNHLPNDGANGGHLHHQTSSDPSQPASFVLLPTQLIADMADTPLAVSLYALIARCFLVLQSAVPLSSTDIMNYDPTLRRGAVLRALNRLTRDGWLLVSEEIGHKTRYTPTWGCIAGTPRPWRTDVERLGRPRHVSTLRLDRRLLDICLGRLMPHPVHNATADRYLSNPVLGLRDVGTYALAHAGIPGETPALIRLGLIRDAQTLPVPPDAQLLALASQPTEAGEAVILTNKGLRIMGCPAPATDAEQVRSGQPLFFVPPTLIGSLIGPVIGSLIGVEHETLGASTAVETAEMDTVDHTKIIQANHGIQGIPGITPQTPQVVEENLNNRTSKNQESTNTVSSAAGEKPAAESSRTQPATDAQVINSPPSTTTRLREIGVRPQIIAELADQPLSIVDAAIADARSRPDVRDLAGWVVSTIRDVRDHGWRIPERPTIGNDMRKSFERLQAMGIGVVLSADEGVENNPVEQPILSTLDIALGDIANDRCTEHREGRWEGGSSCTDDTAGLWTSDAIGAPHPQPLSRDGAKGDAGDHWWITKMPMVPSDGTALCLPYSKEDLTGLVQAELQHWITPQLRPILRPVIQALTIEPRNATVYVVCANNAHRALAETHLLPLISSILRDLGWSTVPRLIATLRF